MGPTSTGDVNNTTDNNSTATQNDYPLYRFWNSASTDAQDNASTNNNTRTRAVITFASGTVLTDHDSDGVNSIEEDLNKDHIFNNDDTDSDGIPNFYDNDDDGDGILTKDEYDSDQDGVADDSDQDGIPDYLDND